MDGVPCRRSEWSVPSVSGPIREFHARSMRTYKVRSPVITAMACRDESLETALQELPSSSRLAFQALLEGNEPLSTAELADQTPYSQRTMRAAVNRLRQCNLVTRRRDITDPHVYRYAPESTNRSVYLSE